MGLPTDGQGRHVDFSNTVVIMTSNIMLRDCPHQHYGLRQRVSRPLRQRDYQPRYVRAQATGFRPEPGTVWTIINFKSLTEQLRGGIVDLMVLAELRGRLLANGMSIEPTEAARI